MKVLDVSIHEAGYRKKESTICDINFDIKEGELIGLIGPNGAGKSTTIKAMIDTLEYVDGSIEFRNHSMRYAYIPEQPVFYEELNLWEHIQFTASVCELSEDEMLNRVTPLLEIFRLENVVDQLPSTFSKGMQQKLMIILAFLTKPTLYIIDEPFIGLDPKAMNDFLRLLKEEREKGAAVLMSTHMLDTAERICDRFILLMQGKVIAKGSMDDIRDTAQLEGANLNDSFEALMERSLS